MNQLAGKVIVITGGAGLIGQSFVKASLEQGAKVIIAEKDIQAANAFVDSIDQSSDITVQEIDITCIKSITHILVIKIMALTFLMLPMRIFQKIYQ